MAQVIRVIIEKTAFLDKVDEHHPVQHERGVPFAVGDFLDTFDESQKGVMLLLEAIVEPLGDLFDVEGRPHPARYIDDAGVVFLFILQGKGYFLQFLDQCFARLVPVMDVVTSSVWPTWFAFYPLPVEGASIVQSINDKVLADGLNDFFLDLLAGRVVGERVFRIRKVLVDDHASLVSDGLEGVGTARDCGLGICSAVVPTEFLDEQRAEVEVLQMCSDPVSV